MNKTYPFNKFTQFYNSIKNDNLNGLKDLLERYPSMLHYHNKKGDGLLSYVFSYNSNNILKYIKDNHSHLFYFINAKRRNVLEQLVHTENEIALNNIFSNLDNSYIKNYFESSESVPIIIQAVQTLEQDILNNFLNLSKPYITSENLNYKDYTGLNILHYLAFHNKTIPQFLKDNISPTLFYEIETNMGNTPLSLAAEYSNTDFFEYLYKNSDYEHINFLNRNIIHLSILNKKENNYYSILKFANQLDYEQADYTENSPLKLAILNKKENIVMSLFEKIDSDISDEIILLIKSYPYFRNFFHEKINKLKINNIKKLSTNKESIATFFSYMFYYADIEFINNVAETPIWQLLELIKNEPFLNNKIYTSSINGRKNMSEKINFLSKYLDIFHVEDTNDIYTYKFENNKIQFFEINNEDRNVKKSFCFVSSLSNLPYAQIGEILKNSEIINDFSSEDWLLLISIIINKNKSELLEYIPESVFSISKTIESTSNLGQMIIENLSNYHHCDQYQKYYELLIRNYDKFPDTLINNNINNTLKHTKELDVFYMLKSPSLKKELYVEITKYLFTTDINYPYINKILFKNENLLFYCFKNCIDFEDKMIKNNALSEYTLSHKNFNNSNKNWHYLFKMKISSDLIPLFLNKTKLISFEDKEVFQKNMSEAKISDEMWNIIFTYHSNKESFEFLLHEYLLYYTISLEKPNINTFNKVAELIDIEKTSPDFFINKLKKDHPTLNKEIYSILFLKESSIENLINIFFKKEDYLYSKKILKEYNLNINNIDFSEFWNNENMNTIFELNLFNNSYTPLEDFINFITPHTNDITPENLNIFMEKFYNWMLVVDLNHATKIKVVEIIFCCFEKQISQINDDILIKISNFSVMNLIPNDSFLLEIDNRKNLNNMLSILFNNNDSEFFEKIYENKEIYHNVDLSDSNKAVFHNHILENSLTKKSNTKKSNHKI